MAEGIVPFLIVAHVVGGTVALAAMWVPLFARKGGASHRRGGWVYAMAMGVVVASALGVCVVRLAEGSAEQRQAALFLAMIALLAAENAWYGIRALGRRPKAVERSVPDLAVSALLLAASAGGLLYGASTGHVLIIAFGVLGVVLGGSHLRALLRPLEDGRVRLMEHLGGMIGACIATVTAFLVVNVRFLPAGVVQTVPALVFWLAPTAVGMPVIVWWGRKLSRGRASSPTPPRSNPAPDLPAQ